MLKGKRARGVWKDDGNRSDEDEIVRDRDETPFDVCPSTPGIHTEDRRDGKDRRSVWRRSCEREVLQNSQAPSLPFREAMRRAAARILYFRFIANSKAVHSKTGLLLSTRDVVHGEFMLTIVSRSKNCTNWLLTRYTAPLPSNSNPNNGKVKSFLNHCILHNGALCHGFSGAPESPSHHHTASPKHHLHGFPAHHYHLHALRIYLTPPTRPLYPLLPPTHP